MNNIADAAGIPGWMITEARGRMGGLVFYMRNGRICARKHVIPANPRTKTQQSGRTRFAAAVRRWRLLDHHGRETWNRRARHMNMSGYNLFISREMDRKKRIVWCAGRRLFTPPTLLRQAHLGFDRRRQHGVRRGYEHRPSEHCGHAMRTMLCRAQYFAIISFFLFL
jgi:hypothetical protein